MTNRITDTPVEHMPVAPERPPLVRARLVYAWRCPDCGKMRLAEKSTTHESACGVCGRPFTVEVR